MKSWKDLEKAPFIPMPNTSTEVLTGDWRTRKPIWYEDKCTHCLLCWLYCPDSCILLDDVKMIGIDYDHCKGCGICVEVCPDKASALELVQEVK